MGVEVETEEGAMKDLLRSFALALVLVAAPGVSYAEEGGEEGGGEEGQGEEKGGEEKGEGVSDKAKAQMFADQGNKFMDKYHETGDVNQARMAWACFGKALQLDKANFDALVGSGEIFLLDKNLGGAAQRFQDAAKLKPKHQRANYFFGATCIELEKYDKAAPALKAAYEATEGQFTDPVMQILLPYKYGKCLAKLGKGEEAVKILRELADGGKFEGFGAREDQNRGMYFEGYMTVGEAYMAMGEFAEADRYLTKALANCKQLLGGPTAEIDGTYKANKYRVPLSSAGQVEGDVFLSAPHKLRIQKPKQLFFAFPHPECYTEEARYKNDAQSFCIWIWDYAKNKDRVWDAKLDIRIEVWDATQGVRMGSVSIETGNPRNVCEVQLDNLKKNFDPVVDRKNPAPTVQKLKFNGMSACTWKGLFKYKENEKIRREQEFTCFVTPSWSFWMSIEGEEGVLKTYAKEIAEVKKSITVLK
jgi:tetratricopeptide (TPR) repeat protein